MDIKEFINNFAEQFDETDINEFSSDTEFKQLEEWSSLHALSIIAMVDESYGVKVTGEDIRNSQTIKDIYEIIKSRK